eukprot:maker-scaffold578_size132436-snap-gene-0.36 protein:Tk11690 transcript:maker-scaffold578_size132436-snap-gene-0.36-mRNA-1 annotation:"probable serine threonine-protein kinase kiny isoform x3"
MSADLCPTMQPEVVWRSGPLIRDDSLLRSKKSTSFCISSLVPVSDVGDLGDYGLHHRPVISSVRRTQSFIRPDAARKKVQKRSRHGLGRTGSFERRISHEVPLPKLGVVEEGQVYRCRHPVLDEEPMKVYNNQGTPLVQEVSSCQALKSAVSSLYNLEDFEREKIGEGFFCEVFKVTHKVNGHILVLKKNKNRSNRWSMLNEVQLMNKLRHRNILKYEAACVHEGQLHALTEHVDGGSLDKWIQNPAKDLPWSLRMSLALDIAKGMAYLHSRGYFHRDLTSKNILIRLPQTPKDSFVGVVADFGLASKIPKNETDVLSQVGSPYWMSPECLHGNFYDAKSDVFSFGIILCEMIARIDADPDILPRTQNFGVDYITFCDQVASDCPPEFLKLAFQCVQMEPNSRPKFEEIIQDLQNLRRVKSSSVFPPIDVMPNPSNLAKVSPSEKARIHPLRPLSHNTYVQIGKEMSLLDPFYVPSPGPGAVNPFALLPIRLGSKEKVVEAKDLFCSCFELGNEKLRKRSPSVRKSVSMIHRDYSTSVDFVDEVLANLRLSSSDESVDQGKT